MSQDVASVIEKGLLRDRRARFRGTAKIRFDNLEFTNGPRKLDEKTAAYLADKFKRQGIFRMEPKNRLPGVIDAETLQAALDVSPEASSQTLLDNPNGNPPELRLPSGLMIDCRQGHHRIEAAKKLLARKDWWWTVDLYLKGVLRSLGTGSY